MIKVFLTMLALQILALTVVITGAAGYDIIAVLVSTWLAYLWGKRQGRKRN